MLPTVLCVLHFFVSCLDFIFFIIDEKQKNLFMQTPIAAGLRLTHREQGSLDAACCRMKQYTCLLSCTMQLVIDLHTSINLQQQKDDQARHRLASSTHVPFMLHRLYCHESKHALPSATDTCHWPWMLNQLSGICEASKPKHIISSRLHDSAADHADCL